MNKEQHERWLRKRGLTRSEVKKKKHQLGRPAKIPIYAVTADVPLSNVIPENGTKSSDTSKATFCNQNYAIAPAFNKGPYQPMSKEDMLNGAGR
jgi:hypothetical protein|tara:strand:- start:51 stop:332 length:282 start_codon:yes stop_codon:yes gene_type:complete